MSKLLSHSVLCLTLFVPKSNEHMCVYVTCCLEIFMYINKYFSVNRIESLPRHVYIYIFVVTWFFIYIFFQTARFVSVSHSLGSLLRLDWSFDNVVHTKQLIGKYNVLIVCRLKLSLDGERKIVWWASDFVAGRLLFAVIKHHHYLLIHWSWQFVVKKIISRSRTETIEINGGGRAKHGM